MDKSRIVVVVVVVVVVVAFAVVVVVVAVAVAAAAAVVVVVVVVDKRRNIRELFLFDHETAHSLSDSGIASKGGCTIAFRAGRRSMDLFLYRPWDESISMSSSMSSSRRVLVGFGPG